MTPGTVESRFASRVDRSGPDGCWLWTGAKLTNGYGKFIVDGRQVLAHRHSFEQASGQISPSLVIDHLCRNRLCVNPDHLDAVTNKENILRGESPPARQSRQTACVRGHDLSGANLHITKGGRRHCNQCTRIRSMARHTG